MTCWYPTGFAAFGALTWTVPVASRRVAADDSVRV